MSTVEESRTENEDSAASDDAPAPEETAKDDSNSEREDKPRRKAKRRSVWVCIPTEFAEVAVQDPDTGEMKAEVQPTRYEITECPGGKGQTDMIRTVLSKHGIDPVNYEHVMMFRGDPIAFQISQQLIIRIS